MSQTISTNRNEKSPTQILLRLFLFVTARTGLFVAIVAWVASHWWCIIAATLVAYTAITPDGVFAGITKIGRNNFEAESAAGYGEKHPFYLHTEEIIKEVNAEPGGFAVSLPFGAALFCSTNDAAVGIFVPQWLNLVFVIALNIVLWFVYRKRPETEPCEV